MENKLSYLPPILEINNILLEIGFTVGSVRVGEDASVEEETWNDVTDTGSYDDILLMQDCKTE